MKERNRLARGLAQIDPRLSDIGLLADIERYVGELELWNPKLGLVEASGPELVTKHLLDCLAGFPLLMTVLAQYSPESQQNGGVVLRLADIGSGAGLPGVLLTLALNRLWSQSFSMTLVEKQQRRVGFLLNVKALLTINNLEICQESLEAVGLRAQGTFHLVTARAFRPLDVPVMADLFRLLRPEGQLFLYKGRRDRINEELRTAHLAQDSSGVRVLPLQVPGLDDERHVLLVSKPVNPSSGA